MPKPAWTRRQCPLLWTHAPTCGYRKPACPYRKSNPQVLIHRAADSPDSLPLANRIRFTTGTSLGFWDRGAQDRGKECRLVDARGQSGDERFQAVVQ